MYGKYNLLLTFIQKVFIAHLFSLTIHINIWNLWSEDTRYSLNRTELFWTSSMQTCLMKYKFNIVELRVNNLKYFQRMITGSDKLYVIWRL